MSLQDIVARARVVNRAIYDGRDFKPATAKLQAVVPWESDDESSAAMDAATVGLTPRRREKAVIALNTLRCSVWYLFGKAERRRDPEKVAEDIESAVALLEGILSTTRPALFVDVEQRTATFTRPGHAPEIFPIDDETALRWLKALADQPGAMVAATDLGLDDLGLPDPRPARLLKCLPPKIRRWIKTKRGKGGRLVLPTR